MWGNKQTEMEKSKKRSETWLEEDLFHNSSFLCSDLRSSFISLDCDKYLIHGNGVTNRCEN